MERNETGKIIKSRQGCSPACFYKILNYKNTFRAKKPPTRSTMNRIERILKYLSIYFFTGDMARIKN